MNLNDYQGLAARTLPDDETATASAKMVMALGLGGETGEVLDLLKKHFGHGHQLDEDKLKKELGDVLWYLAALSTLFGWKLDEIAELNVAKLRARYPEGFSVDRSKNRPAES